jgi:hypothetical protein
MYTYLHIYIYIYTLHAVYVIDINERSSAVHSKQAMYACLYRSVAGTEALRLAGRSGARIPA